MKTNRAESYYLLQNIFRLMKICEILETYGATHTDTKGSPILYIAL